MVEKIFFGAHHGKSECDALGGVAKNLVNRDVTRHPDLLVKNAEDFVVLSRRISKHQNRQYILIKKDDIPSLQLPIHPSIKGTRAIHHSRVVNGVLQARENLCAAECCRAVPSVPCKNVDFVAKWRDIDFRPETKRRHKQHHTTTKKHTPKRRHTPKRPQTTKRRHTAKRPLTPKFPAPVTPTNYWSHPVDHSTPCPIKDKSRKAFFLEARQ